MKKLTPQRIFRNIHSSENYRNDLIRKGLRNFFLDQHAHKNFYSNTCILFTLFCNFKGCAKRVVKIARVLAEWRKTYQLTERFQRHIFEAQTYRKLNTIRKLLRKRVNYRSEPHDKN